MCRNDFGSIDGVRTTIDIPEPLLAAVRHAAAADGTSVALVVEQALRDLIRERVVRQGAPRDAGPCAAGDRPYGRMQEVFDSYLMEGLVPGDGH